MRLCLLLAAIARAGLKRKHLVSIPWLKMTSSILVEFIFCRHRSSRRECSLEKVFSQESTYGGLSFSIKCLRHGCFSVNFANFLRAPMLKIICERLPISLHGTKHNTSLTCFQGLTAL